MKTASLAGVTGVLWIGLCAGCGAAEAPASTNPSEAFLTTPVAEFAEPWAMTFLPDGRLLVTEKKGALKLLDVSSGRQGNVAGVPGVAYGGQGGLGDVIVHPGFAQNQIVYLSYAEPGEDGASGAAVARARLVVDAQGGGKLEGLTVIWQQVPKVQSNGHWGHRMAFGPDGKLWVTSSERQKFAPSQDMKSTLGKVVRLNDDGSPPPDNPFASQGGVTAQIWSLGHRNPLGIAFDAGGRLFAHEMGPRGGDELNIIERGANYGYPVVSNGDHYSGLDIPDHPARPEFKAPLITWNPVISPAGFIIYSGAMFPDWAGDGFIGGLSSKALIRVEFGDGTAREAQRFDMGQRIREVEQGPDGAIWLLEDERSGAGGRLLKLTAPRKRSS
jgi:glucose/arabinose dehydrogenase